MSIRETSWPTGTPCWVDLAVPDVAAATMFYRVVLGWSFVDTGPEFQHYTVCRTFRRAAAAIGPHATAGQPSVWTVYLASDDADLTAKRIVENGGTLLVEPTDIGDNGRMCVALGHLRGRVRRLAGHGDDRTGDHQRTRLPGLDGRPADRPGGRRGLLRRRLRLPLPADPRCSWRLQHLLGRRPRGGWHRRDDGRRRARRRTGSPTSRWTTSTPRSPTRSWRGAR